MTEKAENERKPLTIQDNRDLRAKVEQAIILFDKGQLNTDLLREVFVRLMQASFQWSFEHIYEKDIVIIKNIYSSKKIVKNLDSLKKYFIKDKENSEFSKAFVLAAFPSDLIGETFFHALKGKFLLEELKRQKDNRFLKDLTDKTLHALKKNLIQLSDRGKAKKSIEARREYYTAQIKANIEKMPTASKPELSFLVRQTLEMQNHKLDLQAHIDATKTPGRFKKTVPLDPSQQDILARNQGRE
jgi:hypothetical protein